MAKGTCQARLQFLVVSFVVQAAVLQTLSDLPLKTADMPSIVTPQETSNATISSSHGIPTVSSKQARNKTTIENADTSITAIGNANSFPSPSASFAQTTQSSHKEASGPAEITDEKTTETTDFPTESFISNSTYQAPVEDSKVTTSAITQKLTAQSSATASLSSSKISASQFPVAGTRMKTSEFVLTVGFALILILTILGLVVYILNKYRIRRAQYSHHQLYDTTFDTVDTYDTPDDTLVISGGLYDASRIYNSNTTPYEDEAPQMDHLSFSAQPGQFRLEFFGENENSISFTSETVQVPSGSL